MKIKNVFSQSFLLTFLLFLFLANITAAAGSCSLEESKIGYKKKWLTYICTADSADGTISNTAIIGLNDFFLYSVEIWPGGTAPTDLSDMTILDDVTGEDLLGGNGADAIDATDSNTILPKSAKAQAVFGHIIKGEPIMTITQAAAATNSAVINVRVSGVR